VLVVDDEPGLPDLVAALLGREQVDVTGTEDEGEAVQLALDARQRGVPFDVVLLDYYLARSRGEAVVHELNRVGIDTRVILMSGRSPTEVALEALRLGVFDFVAKPLTSAELRLRVERACRDRPSSNQDQRRSRKSDILIGGGVWMKQLYERISMVSGTDVTVAIFGESGTGKELVARTIHNLSPRHECPFVVVNCAAIPENLLEDELFGHVRGAFTDATRDRQGLIAAAHTGTLFLDEIGEMSPPLQAKLLRVLQNREVRRIGEDRDTQVDVRIVTATNRDLEKAVAAGTFRQDLYYRINVFPITLAPLRERVEDIAVLAHHFLLRIRGKIGKEIDGLSPAAIARLQQYDFPGNVRELENKIHQAVVVAAGPNLEPDDLALPMTLRPEPTRLDLLRPFRDLKQDVIDHFEKDYLTALLEKHEGNLAAAARQAGMDRKNLWALVQKHQLSTEKYRSKRGEPDSHGE
jgi:DNA-binding NtrC family response regulator